MIAALNTFLQSLYNFIKLRFHDRSISWKISYFKTENFLGKLLQLSQKRRKYSVAVVESVAKSYTQDSRRNTRLNASLATEHTSQTRAAILSIPCLLGFVH